jgi:transposase-like protein
LKDDNWIVCNSCESEYKVVSSISNDLTQSYCPFCGSDLEDQLVEEDYDEFFEDT